MISVALRVIWSRDVKAIAAKVERRTDRVMPYPPTPRIARQVIELEGRETPLLLTDQREMFGR